MGNRCFLASLFCLLGRVARGGSARVFRNKSMMCCQCVFVFHWASQQNIQVENPPAICLWGKSWPKHRPKPKFYFKRNSCWRGAQLERWFWGEICRNACSCLWEHPRSLEAFPFSPNWQLLPRTQLHEGEVVQCIWNCRAELSCGLLVATGGNTWDILIRIMSYPCWNALNRPFYKVATQDLLQGRRYHPTKRRCRQARGPSEAKLEIGSSSISISRCLQLL